MSPRVVHAALLTALLFGASSCATREAKPDAPASAGSPAEAPGVPSPSGALADEEEAEPGPPTTWSEAHERFEFKCPAPAFTLETPRRVGVGDTTFLVEGSVARRENAPSTGKVTLGVLGALKDAAPATRENVQKAARQFAKAGVDVVLANGDLGEDRELEDVFAMLGEELSVPVFVHSGNMEWTSAFARAMRAVEEKHPHVLNLNWVSHVELGAGVHLLALPGYHDLQFLKPGGCRYQDEDLARLTALAKELRAQGHTVVLTAHGPPQQTNAQGLDVAYDDAGNVGDPRVTALLEEGDISVGIFSHILEAGGRATKDPRGKEPVRLPVTKPLPSLYVNVGSASAFPWTLHGGKSAEGMAFVVTLSADGVLASRHDL